MFFSIFQLQHLKQFSDYDGSSSTSKRPRVQTDERELKVPLERGWKRSTTILAIGKRGFIGEVLYFAPCGKKMKTIPDVMRVSTLVIYEIVIKL